DPPLRVDVDHGGRGALHGGRVAGTLRRRQRAVRGRQHGTRRAARRANQIRAKGDDQEGECQSSHDRSGHEDQCASQALEHDKLRENPRCAPASAHPGGGVRLCIMRRPPQGTKSRHTPRSSARRCERTRAESGWMADHAVVAEDEVDLSRRKFLTRAAIATGAVGAAFAAVPFIESWAPSERARAHGAPTDLDLSKLEAGQRATPVWRRSPIYVVRRTPDMVARIAGHDADLKDPSSEHSDQPAYARNTLRSRNAEYLVLVCTCTHLGCLPKQRFAAGDLYPSWPGGFFCPCHRSRLDLARRVF